MKAIHRALAGIILVASALVTTACSSDGTGPENGIEGTYKLTRVNESALPVIAFTYETGSATVELEVVSGDVVLDGNGYDSRLVARIFLDGQPLQTTETITDAGTYTVDGGTITFKSEGASQPFTGSIDGSVLTISASHPEYGSFTAEYRK